MNKRQILRAAGAATAVVTAAMMGAAALAAIGPGPAPDFTLKAMDGRNLRLHEQRGQVVMVNFWATWCAPCKQEMPHLNALYKKYKDSGFVLLGVNVDDDPSKAAAMAQSFGLAFPVLYDAGKTVARTYNLGAMPSTVLIDRDGVVRHIHRGYRDGLEATYEAQARALLKE
jgi:peroxiredoxin